MSFEHEKPFSSNDGVRLFRSSYGQQYSRSGPPRRDSSTVSVPTVALMSESVSPKASPGREAAHGTNLLLAQPRYHTGIGKALTDSSNFIEIGGSDIRGLCDGVPVGNGGRDVVKTDFDERVPLQRQVGTSRDDAAIPLIQGLGPLGRDMETLSVTDAYRERQEQWAERGAAKVMRSIKDPKTGEITKQVIKRGIKDFKFGDALGDGSYSTVLLATSIESNRKYAAKVLNKEYLIRQKKVKYVNIEKNTLQRLNNSRAAGIIKLYFTFQDEANLYFLLEYAPNGDFLSMMKKYGTLSEECARYYSAQILSAISCLHKEGIIHRDIKPENILLDKNWKIKLTDFGTAKLLEQNDDDGSYDLYTRSKSFVGTAEYVSPELLNDNWVDHRCDIWAFGCILFQMIAGKPPFKAANEYLTFQKVMKIQYAFTAGFPSVVRDLVKKILVKKPEQRLGISQIEKHQFFGNLNFEDGSVWSNPAPEITPYKITAKAMQPVAGIKDRVSKSYNKDTPKRNSAGSKAALSAGSGTASSQVTPTRQSQAPQLGSLRSTLEVPKSNTVKLDPQTARILGHARAEIESRKSQARSGSASSAAAAALYKRKPSSNSGSAAPSSSSNSNRYAPHSAPTHSSNVNSSHSITTATVSKASQPNTAELPPNFKTATRNSPPMGKLDILWSAFLLKLDERIIKAGELKVSVVRNDTLERRIDKIHGVMVDTMITTKATLLSQVVRNGGHTTGFRSLDKTVDNMNEEDFYKEKALKWENVELDYQDTQDETDIDVEGSALGNTIRKFFSGVKLADLSDLAHSDSYQNRMVLLTNYGRCLLLVKTIKPSVETRVCYESQYEVYLSQPGVSLKEIHTESNGLIDTFLIQNPFNSFIFKCTPDDLNAWIDAFTDSIKRNNERLLLLASKDVELNAVANAAARISVGQPPISSTVPSATLSKQPSKSHTLTSTKTIPSTSQTVVEKIDSANTNSPTVRQNSEFKHERLFESFVSRKSYEKPPVQPVPESRALLHGLPVAPSSNLKRNPKRTEGLQANSKPKNSNRTYGRIETGGRR